MAAFAPKAAPRETAPLEPADELLVAHAIDGDAAAFRMLILRHAPALLSIATRILGSAISADDAVQETFVIAWTRLPQLRERAHVKGWLIRIATHQAFNHLRRQQRDVPYPAMLRSVGDTDPEVMAGRNAQLADLHLALQALTTVQRDCWILREVEQMRYFDIADSTGLTPGQVRGNIARARVSIKTTMQDWR